VAPKKKQNDAARAAEHELQRQRELGRDALMQRASAEAFSDLTMSLEIVVEAGLGRPTGGAVRRAVKLLLDGANARVRRALDDYDHQLPF
jgi:hypothetical protein